MAIKARQLPPSRDPPSGDAFEVHRQMAVSLFAATLIVSAILGFGIYLDKVTALMAVAAAGAIGGFVSALRRLYSFQRVFPINFFKKGHKADLYLVIYSMIPSIVGLIAAVTLYLIFASGLITGQLFPNFSPATESIPKADPFQNFVWNWRPSGAQDYAKALVWSFLAGFSERFVPDLLTHLASAVEQKENHVAADHPSEEDRARAEEQS